MNESRTVVELRETERKRDEALTELANLHSRIEADGPNDGVEN
jgi:hypothetical protein